MAKHGKKYVDALKAAPKAPVTLKEAVAFVKAHAGAKFDETVEVAMHLGVDISKSDQTVRGTVKLPNGSGKKVTVLVFAAGDLADAARAAGADYVGLDDMIDKISKEGWTGFDVAISTVEAMKSVRKCARFLGPRGLMPNPKTGTVTEDLGPAVKAAKGGKVEFRMDRTGNLGVVCGKLSFAADKLVENFNALLAAVKDARPATLKGTFIRSCTVSSTMGVGVRVIVKE